MLRKKLSIAVVFLALAFLLVSITSCWPFIAPDLISPGPRMDSTFRFSIKNASNSDVKVDLVVGKIPNRQARFDEFEVVSDEIYTVINEYWSSDFNAHCTVKPKTHNNVTSHIPIAALVHQTSTIEWQEEQAILQEHLLNKLISFVLTISKDGTIIYRIVGWDIPDEDMEKYQINDELLGYYNTSPESYIDPCNETISVYPLFFSKLIEGEPGTYFGGEFTFYIKATSNDAHVQEFNPYSAWVNEDDYWK
jgi:hypothetical protein